MSNGYNERPEVRRKNEEPGCGNPAIMSAPLEPAHPVDPPEDLYRMLFETMTSGVILQDASGYVTMANPAAYSILGLTLDQLRSDASPYWQAINEDGSLLLQENHPAAVALRTGQAVANIVMGVYHPIEQRYRWLKVCAVPLFRPYEDKPYLVQTVFDRSIPWDARPNIPLHARQEQKALEVLLAMLDVLVQRTNSVEPALPVPDSALCGTLAATVEYHLLELTCRVLSCRHAGIALLDSETSTLHPLFATGSSHEDQQYWRNRMQHAYLNKLITGSSGLSLLQTGEILSLDLYSSAFGERSMYQLVAPILLRHELIGLLFLDYGWIEPRVSPYEHAVILGVARLAALVMQREKDRSEKEYAISALQAANEELARLNKTKSNVIALVSHEFRSALTGIQGFSEIIRDQDLSMETIREYAVDIYADARRLVCMINDMLDLERLESGSVKLNLEWLNLNTIISDVVGRIGPTAPHHPIRLQLATALPILLGDRDKLTQVVANLLTNAIKYSPAGSEILVRSRVEWNLVHVSVSDQGVGIPAAELELIFKQHARTLAGKMRYVSNTGLGLPIAREIILLHGGQIWAESTSGQGSTFHFTVRFASMH